MARQFRNRTEAGRLLAQLLMGYANRPDVLVLGLPRGGIPVAFEIATALNAPLDALIVRKLGVPDHKELAMGAIALNGIIVINTEVVQSLRISKPTIRAVALEEQQELERRDRLYRGERPPLYVHNQTLIVVDDGIATGSTLRAAIAALKQHQPQHLIVATPVAPVSTHRLIQSEVDELVCLQKLEPLNSIGMWYEDFSQTTDDEVCALLSQAKTQSTPVTR